MTTVDQLGLARCRLMKIDVEGMESEALKGATQTIERLRPILYVENNNKDKSAELTGLIESFNYRMSWHVPPLFNEKNFLGNDTNVFGDTVSLNMVCVPAESDENFNELPSVRSG